MNTAEKASEAFSYIQKHLPEVYEKYLEFTKSMAIKGDLSPRDKELILVACSVMSQCDMCIAIHVEAAGAPSVTR